MKGQLKQFGGRLVLLLSVVGPGIITAMVDNDAGGITTYSVAGARYGYSLVWSFLPILVALVIIQEMCSRMAVVTGKGLADLIREQFGVRVTFYAMLVLVASNIFNTISEFAGVAASAGLFNISKYILVPLAALAVWLLIVKGTYRSVEKIFLVACVFYIAYIVSGLVSGPDWNDVTRQSLHPNIDISSNAYIFMLIGVIGTTIAPWMQFYQQSSVVEKGIKLENYRYARWDVIIGAFVVNIVAFFIMIVCANILFTNGIQIQSAREAAEALKPLAGDYCYFLFAFGLLNASIFSACILPLSTAYSVCEGMGWETGVNKRFREAPQFYTLYTLIIVIGAAVILIPNVPLIPIMLISQAANGVLLPFVLVFMLLLVNNKRLMGAHVNSVLLNVVSIVIIVAMIGLSLVLVGSLFFTV
jgi:NRAMP (natural resistance-associated macrophage protein)-like metal ion transporter